MARRAAPAGAEVLLRQWPLHPPLPGGWHRLWPPGLGGAGLVQWLVHIAVALAETAGARLSRGLGLGVSRYTLLRLRVVCPAGRGPPRCSASTTGPCGTARPRGPSGLISRGIERSPSGPIVRARPWLWGDRLIPTPLISRIDPAPRRLAPSKAPRRYPGHGPLSPVQTSQKLSTRYVTPIATPWAVHEALHPGSLTPPDGR